MNKNVVIVLIGGFVVAILVAVLVQASLGGKQAPKENAPVAQVLVAAKELPVGTELKSGDLSWQDWPGQTFSGAITRDKEQKPEEALSGRLTTRVAQGQPVLSSYIFKEGRGNIVAATMAKGMRAVAISVKADTMAGGFISPGDYVDIILTYQVRGNTNTPEIRNLVNQVVSETILKNVRVLAVDQETTRSQDAAKIGKTITVEVDSEGAEKVALAEVMGDMSLSLRALGDDEIENTSAYTTDVKASQILQNMARIENGGPTTGAVKIYNGSQILELRPNVSVPVTLHEDNTASTDDESVSGENDNASDNETDEGYSAGSVEDNSGEGETQ
jgi:pilus assembly protein CpaB